MKRIIRPAARDDIMRQFRYYLVDQDLPDVANRFLNAIETTIGKILSTPNAGAPRPLFSEALVSLRSWPVEGFEDIRVYYRAEEHAVRGSGRIELWLRTSPISFGSAQ